MSNVDTVIARTDWEALKEQKLQLVLAIDRTETSIRCDTLSPEESTNEGRVPATSVAG